MGPCRFVPGVPRRTVPRRVHRPLGGRILAEAFALAIVDAFLTTPFEGDRHQPRLDQIAAIAAQECD